MLGDEHHGHLLERRARKMRRDARSHGELDAGVGFDEVTCVFARARPNTRLPEEFVDHHRHGDTLSACGVDLLVDNLSRRGEEPLKLHLASVPCRRALAHEVLLARRR